MNEYEARRLAKIQKNQSLLAELHIKPVVPHARKAEPKQRSSKKRKLDQDATAPSRASARIAAAPARPSYNEDEIGKPVALPRSATKRGRRTPNSGTNDVEVDEPEPVVPVKNVDEIRAGWSDWKAVSSPPKRDESMTYHFPDHPIFTPNKSPEEMLREGCFGGSYYRPLLSRKLGIRIDNDWEELPAEWIAGLPVQTYLTSPTYNPEVNKFKVACGQSIEEWEAAGWISHEHDVRGWFQWYTRFFRGRRCEDDERQIRRWKNCVGETGRWRRMLLKKYRQMGVREVFDDGEAEDAEEVSPVMHQTCHQWAFEVRQHVLDDFWEREGG